MAEVEVLEQKRAKLAWDFIQEIKNMHNNDQKDFKSAIRKLPAMLLTSGLGQTVAFHLSKGKDKPHYKIIENVAKALEKLTKIYDIGDADSFIKKISNCNHETYIILANEALKYITWLKRFAEAELEG